VSVSPVVFLFRDESVVVVDKPAGLVCHRTELAPDRDVVMTRVRDALGAYVYPVHRLDRGTSGALVFALSSAVAARLRVAFDEGRVAKTYLALARGHAPERVTVDYAIPKAEDSPVRVAAITDLERVGEGDHCSLVVARPRTGRYHQIRRHLAHLRHPLALDSRYGTGWFNRDIRARSGLTRLALHAFEIAFPHPAREDDAPPLRVRAPVAADLRAALVALGLGDALAAFEARDDAP
jgi:tRNA pseudouridine65 synthase